MKDQLEKNFAAAYAWLVSNELHLDDYESLISLEVAPGSGVKIHITHACAVTIGIKEDKFVVIEGFVVYRMEEEGLQITWVAE